MAPVWWSVVLVLVIAIVPSWSHGVEENSTNVDSDKSLDSYLSYTKKVLESQKRKKLLNEQLEKQLWDVIEHYKQDDPVGIPGAPIPDPFPVPDLQQQFAVAKMKFREITVHGLSKFRVNHVKSDVAAMKVDVGVTVERMEILGKYTMSTWFRSSQGNFNITIIDVYTAGGIRMDVDQEGYLEAQDIKMDLKFRDIKMNFENLGFMGSIFQGIINSVATFVFNSIKPIILGTVNTNVKTDVNKEIRNLPFQFPNSISPLDMAMVQVRKYIQENGFDPFKLEPYAYSLGRTFVIQVRLHDGELRGISSIYRSGNITLDFQDNIATIETNIATQELSGVYYWTLTVGFLSTTGSIRFILDSVDTKVSFTQPVNVEKAPTINEIDVQLGNLNVYSDGAGTADYIIEATANILPNLLRNQIMDIMEVLVKRGLQDYLNEVDIEELIRQNV